MEIKLVVVGGEFKTNEVVLRLPATLGRGREASVALGHPLVSRQHCRLYVDGDRVMVKDLGSLNGTFINNERITEAELPVGHLLTVGTLTFRAAYGASDAAAEQPPTGRKTETVPTTDRTLDMGRKPAKRADKGTEQAADAIPFAEVPEPSPVAAQSGSPFSGWPAPANEAAEANLPQAEPVEEDVEEVAEELFDFEEMDNDLPLPDAASEAPAETAPPFMFAKAEAKAPASERPMEEAVEEIEDVEMLDFGEVEAVEPVVDESPADPFPTVAAVKPEPAKPAAQPAAKAPAAKPVVAPKAAATPAAKPKAVSAPAPAASKAPADANAKPVETIRIGPPPTAEAAPAAEPVHDEELTSFFKGLSK